MAKNPVEQAPKLVFSGLKIDELMPYLSKYGVTDERGRYLHWS